MGFITGIVDVQDANGNSIVQATGPNATRSPLVLKMSSTISASFAQSGDQGLVTLATAGSGAALSGSSLTLGSQTPPQFQESPNASQQTTSNATITLTTYAVPAGKMTVIQIQVFACIFTSTTAFIYNNTAQAVVVRVGSGAVVTNPVNGPVNFFSNSSPAAPFASAGNPGGLGFTVVGTSVVLSAQGLGTPGAWSETTYTVGQLVTKSSNIYGVISISGSGTSTSGPSGTGTTVDNAGANQVTWDYIGPTSGGVPITWGPVITTVYTP